MALPTVLLLVLMITGCTLPGAELGIDAYIGKFDFSVFVTKPDIWSAAAAQVFFSTSLGSAVMMTFASYNRQDNPCAQDSYIVCAADLCFSFISGFCVFTVAGYLSYTSGVPIDQLPINGSGMAYQTYAVGAGSLVYPVNNIMCFLFFFMLFLVGLDSLVSLAEAVINAFSTSRFREKVKRIYVVAVICASFWLVGLIYCGDYGASLLDEVDYYVNNLGLLLMGLLNCLTIGWVFNADVAIRKVGLTAYLWNAVLWLGGTVAGTAIAIWCKPAYIGAIIMLVSWIASFVFSYFMISETDCNGDVLSFKEKMYWMTIGNFEETKREINSYCGKGQWYHFASFSTAWVVITRYVSSAALIFLIGNNIFRPQFWNRTSIAPLWLTLIAILALVVMGLVPIVVGAMIPWLFEPCLPTAQLRWIAGQKVGGKVSTVWELSVIESKLEVPEEIVEEIEEEILADSES
eukprot:Selendium_serpulae@DN5497_c0_g1_i1.p1